MKQPYSISGLVAVISLTFSVIWLSPVVAAESPTFVSLGQIMADKLRAPGAMDLDEAGNLYVADTRGGLVHQFNPNGDLLQSFDLQATGRGVAVTPDGEYLYVSRKQSVVIANADGTVVGALVDGAIDGPEFDLAGEIDLDAFGNVFVVDEKRMQVKVYDASGQYQARFGTIGRNAGQFTQIGGMAINRSGKVVVADASADNGKIHVFSMNADLSVAGVVAYSKLNPANFGSPYMHMPRGLTFDNQGRGYFLDFNKTQIRVNDENFNYLGSYAQKGHGEGQLSNVVDTIFDAANGRLFVGCDTKRIVILGVDNGQNPISANSAPTIPVPQKPIGGSVVDSAFPSMVFSNAVDPDGDALTYKVVVTQNGKVVTQIETAAAAGETTSVTVTDVELEENAAYAWTVEAYDANTSSGVGVTADFVVNAVDEVPGTPELLTPADSALVAGADILSWTVSVDPDPNDFISGYLIEIASDASFADVLATQSVDGNTLVLADLQDYALLEDGSSYTWRVTALDHDQTASEESLNGQFVFDTTTLTITANISDAQVYLGGNHAFVGRFVGIAPMELRDVPAGTISLVVNRPGFEPYVTSLEVDERDNVSHAAVLTPAMEVDTASMGTGEVNGSAGIAVDGNAAPFLVDYDNDGMLDMVVGDAAGSVHLYTAMENSGPDELSFSPGVTLKLPVLPGAVPFVADWDNDGRKDLLVGLDDGTVRLFLNNGQEMAPAFGEGLDLDAGTVKLDVGFAAAPAVVDYDGDGRKDLLVGNGDGQVQIFANTGTDAAPQLADPLTLFATAGSVVPMPVDWDADGLLEIMTTASGVTTVYSLQDDGSYLPSAQLGIKRVNKNSSYSNTADSFSAFPVDLDGDKVKEFLIGSQEGKLLLLGNKSKAYVASFSLALQVKLGELGGLIADEAPERLADFSTLSEMIAIDDYTGAAQMAKRIADRLETGAAQASALELADILK